MALSTEDLFLLEFQTLKMESTPSFYSEQMITDNPWFGILCLPMHIF